MEHRARRPSFSRVRTHTAARTAARQRGLVTLAALASISLLTGGCAGVRRLAVDRVGDVLTSGTGSTFESDDDLELIGDALPFSLKLLESLIAESPRHAGLRLAACRGFALYSYGWVDFAGEVAWEQDIERARRLRERAGRLYLRAHRHCLAGLERWYPGVAARLVETPGAAAAEVGVRSKAAARDVPYLYWTAASLGLAISSSRSDVALLARLPEAEALAARALELDAGWGEGALHELAMSLEAAAVDGPDFEVIERHYRAALELAGGAGKPGLFVSYAELVAVPRQDAELFRSLLARALAIDPAAEPDDRLRTALSQRRASWLLGRVEDLIVEDAPAGDAEPELEPREERP
jgi:predicted anti-sigma-YlaC factor YlaD